MTGKQPPEPAEETQPADATEETDFTEVPGSVAGDDTPEEKRQRAAERVVFDENKSVG